MNAVVERKGEGAEPAVSRLPVQTEAAAMISMIERAARDPSVDVDKLVRLLAVQRDVASERAQQAFNASLSDAQSEMRPIATDCINPQTKSKYASYYALDKAIRPIYTKHGFALSFDTGDGAPENYVRVICHVSHRDGFTRSYHFDMPADGKGAKGGDVMTRTHAAGAASSYGCRYLLRMIFNVAIGEDDDDGNLGHGARITHDQVLALDTLIEEVAANRKVFLQYFKIERLEDMPAAEYARAVASLEKKRGAK